MRRTLVVSIGTIASAAAQRVRQRRQDELKTLRRKLTRAPEPEQSALRLRSQQLLQAMRIQAFDLDGTQAYRLPAPLESEEAQWGPGEFVKISLSPQEVLPRLEAGQLAGIRQVNSQALRGLQNENASGGARPTSDLAFQVAEDRVRTVLRGALITLLESQPSLPSIQNHGIRVFLVAGLFGGTGSGAYQRMKHWLLEQGQELGVHLDVYPVLMLPGARASKDPENSYANTFAVLKELSADSTGSLWQATDEDQRTASARANFRAPFLVSDSNNAPDAPRVVSEEAFAALAGDMIFELTATPLGSHLDAQAGDFSVAGETTSSLGEPCQARSIGLSSVFLDVERQSLWSWSELALKYVEQSTTAAGEAAIRQAVRTFLEGNHLVVGDGSDALSNRLLRLCNDTEKLSFDRVHTLFGLATEGLRETQLLTEGRNRLNLSIQQAGEFGPALRRHASAVAEELDELVRSEMRRLLTNRRFGAGSASKWLAVAGGVTDAMLASAAAQLSELEAEVKDLDERIAAVEAEALERLNGRGLWFRALHSGALAQSAAEYRSDLEAWATQRIRAEAAACAIQVVRGLRATIQREIQETVQPILSSLSALTETLRENQRRAANHAIGYGCPNGLALLRCEGDLEELHERCFPAADEQRIADEIDTALARLEDPAATLSEAGTAAAFFNAAAGETLAGARLGDLHVADELMHRYPGEEQLGAVLAERDLEAYERLPLAATSDHSNGVTVIRLAGLGGSRMQPIRPVLDKYQTDRGVRYLPVDTGDRQRMVFLQVRAVFPFSDWRSFGIARRSYDAAHQSSATEIHHVIPGHRFLPIPGTRLAAVDLAGLLLRAWTLGRLEVSPGRGWLVLPASVTDPPVPVGPGPSLTPQAGYRLAVDLVSSTSCFVSRRGPSALHLCLDQFEKQLGQGTGVCGLNQLPPAMLAEGVKNLHQEAEWWAHNTLGAVEGWNDGRAAQ